MLEKYKNVFLNNFPVTDEQLVYLKYQDIPEWDSVGHMSLIADLEDALEIEFEADDIVDFSSYEVGMEIVKKYGIDLQE